MSVKETVLQVLQNPHSQDGFVSGQELAERCEVSRTSVWKAIEALRKQGAEIEAVTNRGYKLNQDSIFSKESIESFLPKESGISVVFFDSTDSTNTQAKIALSKTESSYLHKKAFVAAEQTAGRGRMGRSFFSPSKTGIYLSLVYSKNLVMSPALITASAAVAVCRAIFSVYGIQGQIKWVNDIFINQKKVCGILTEGTTNFETGKIESAVIGIGVNIFESEFLPKELASVAGSIITGEKQSKRSELCALILWELEKILDGTGEVQKNAMDEYKKRSFLIGKTVEVRPVINQNEQNYICTVKDICDDAKLKVMLPDGSVRLLESGEVSVRQE